MASYTEPTTNPATEADEHAEPAYVPTGTGTDDVPEQPTVTAPEPDPNTYIPPPAPEPPTPLETSPHTRMGANPRRS